MTVRRNDPCPCGSGKKYKHCCLPKQEPISLLNVRAERNHEALLDRLLRLATALPSDYGMADGLARYYGERDLDEPTQEELLEPLDWVLFGYRSPATGTTLAESVAQEAGELPDEERQRVQEWGRGAIPGFFHVIQPGPGEVHLRRTLDATSVYIVNDRREGLQTGDLLAAWLLPDPSGLRFGYDQMILPPEVTRPLEHLLRVELTLLQRQRPGATMHDLYRDHWPRLIESVAVAQTLGDGCLEVQVPPRPVVEGTPQSHPAWEAVARRFTQMLEEHGGGPEEVAGGLRLWWDAVHALQPRVHRVEPWVGALLYLLSHYVYRSDETKGDVAVMVGTSAASVGSRSREIADALSIAPADPRYADLMDPFIRLRYRVDLT